MLMWYVILVVLIATTIAGLFYLSGRLEKFGFMSRILQKNMKRRRIVCFMIVVAAFLLLAMSMNLMNAVVCLLHLVFLWMLCDLFFGIAGYIRSRPFRYYYAGTAAIVLSFIVLAAGWYWNHNVEITRYEIMTDKDVDNLRVVLFADSHIGTTFDSAGFAGYVKQMEQEKPDVVVIAGDFVDDGTSREEMIAASRALGRLKTTYGVFFAFGNHDKGYWDPAERGFDGKDLIAELTKNGVRVLQDEAVAVGRSYYIVGRQDLSEIQRGGMRAEMSELVKNLDKTGFVIVADHQPNDYQRQAAAGVDLVLSGHTHGGQLFPLNRAGEWIGANDRTYGREQRQQTDFIVTSGLSDWSIKFKTGTRSEFVVIDIKKKHL